MGQHLPLIFEMDTARRPLLRADVRNLAVAVDAAWDALRASNSPPWLYRAAGDFVYVVPDDSGRPTSKVVSPEHLRFMLARVADWKQKRRNGFVDATPPMALVRSLLATPDPDLPVLAGIVRTPVFGRSGELLITPGYHADAQLLYCPTPDFRLPLIPERPTTREIDAARVLICQDLLGDFPFISEAERAHAVAMLLLGFGRSLIAGPTPLHMIDKPTPGTGATLLTKVAATILTGDGVAMMNEPPSDSDWRKELTAKLREAPTIVVIDNLRRRLTSSAFAAVLTGCRSSGRILGSSQMVDLPNACTWIATGNNVQISNEMARRMVRVRLDAGVVRPSQDRTDFRHPELEAYIRDNRSELVAACLTLWQAWIARGRPQGGPTLGSFEEWSKVMSGLLQVAGIDGFLGNLEEVKDASDFEGSGWSNFIDAWFRLFGTRVVTVKGLFRLACECEPGPDMTGSTDRAMQTSLGVAIRSMKDRRFYADGHQVQLVSAGTLHNAAQWKLEFCEQRRRAKQGELDV